MSPDSRFRLVRLAFLLALMGAVRLSLLAGPPDWLMKCAALPTPGFAGGAPAVVLLDQALQKIDAKGRRSETRRYAVRILAAGGERYASASIAYLAGRDTAKGQGAWLIRGGKEFRPPGSRTWADVVLEDDVAFTEYRAKSFSYVDLASPGDVFAFEATLEGGMLFTDQINIWRSELPTLTERYGLTLPEGWSLTARVDGDRPLVESRSADGLTWSWTLRDRPFRPDEPYAAQDEWFDARLMVSIQRPAAAGQAGPVSFASWRDVSDWKIDFVRGQCDRDDALAETVGRLTAGLANPVERIRAVSRHVQQLRYVSVNRSLGIGFGYRPRKATEVNARGWGDCKDKANLMCAMLRDVGVTAYLASANIGMGRVISPDWPNPQQFNHAIVAIPVDESVDLPAVVPTSRFGRVLFFDATDPNTMLGDLPAALQGSRVLIVAEGSDDLTTLPVLPSAQNRCLERTIEVMLASNGAVAGVGTFSGRGQSASALRGMVWRRSTKELEDMILQSLGTPLRGAVLRNVKVTDDPVADRCEIQFELAAPKFCQFLPGNLALVKLDLFARAGMPSFPNRERVLPVKLEGMQVRERVAIVLPERFETEELPAAVALNEDFASYENRVEVRDGVLDFERVLTLQEVSISVAEYGRVRQFVGEVSKADKASAVLRVAPR